MNDGLRGPPRGPILPPEGMSLLERLELVVGLVGLVIWRGGAFLLTITAAGTLVLGVVEVLRLLKGLLP